MRQVVVIFRLAPQRGSKRSGKLQALAVGLGVEWTALASLALFCRGAWGPVSAAGGND
jgi:hypothetical protein